MTERPHYDDLAALLAPLRSAVAQLPGEALLEIVMDLGRPPQARLPGRALMLAEAPVTRDDLAEVVQAVGVFGPDNRAGIEGTLHRISAIRNRGGEIVGLTLRVGRTVRGGIAALREFVEQGRSLLLLGPPGVGKTTKLREIARVLADEYGRRVIVIDTSNEIAGDGDVPHPAIGLARRMQVPGPDRQHTVMIEAVENHMPEVIVIDEIGTSAEVLAARTIAERGVQLVGTAHGNTLENLVRNPTLADLVGGVQTVTLGDEEARLRGTRKSIVERKRPPTFESVVELRDHEHLMVHPDTAVAVDAILAGREAGGLECGAGDPDTRETALGAKPVPPRPVRRLPGGAARILPWGVKRDLVERVIRELRLDAVVTERPERAHLVVVLRARSGEPRLLELIEETGLPVHVLRRNTAAQLRRVLQQVFHRAAGVADGEAEAAAREAEAAVARVMTEGVAVELPPRPPAVRRLQHRIVTRHRLLAESRGREPERRLVVVPPVSARPGD